MKGHWKAAVVEYLKPADDVDCLNTVSKKTYAQVCH